MERSGDDPAQAASIDAKLLVTLQRLLAMPAMALKPALDQSGQILSETLGADKVDVMLYDESIDSLVALGTSQTELARQQRQMGMDRLPLANGGRTVEVFQSGVTYHTGRADLDPQVLRGFREGLGIRSLLVVPMVVEGARRGVLSVSSQRPEVFAAADRLFLEAVAHWIGLVVQRTELLERSAQAAASQVKQRTAEELITTLAHDLGNYLAPLSGRLELALRRAEREGRERDQRDLGAARETLAQLERLINNLLDVGRLTHNRLELAPELTDLALLAAETAALFGSEQQPIALRAAEEVCVMIDRERMRQVLGNLCSNALKHCPPGTPIAIEAAARPDGEWALLTVRDAGPGIAPELLPTLFNRFVLGANSSGLGLGLSIAHGIVAAHGGSLTVESALGQGSAFHILLPLAA